MTSSAVQAEIRNVRLAVEAAVLRRLNAGYGFVTGKPAVETYFASDQIRDRVGRDLLRPSDTHRLQLDEVEAALSDGAVAAASPVRELAARLKLAPIEFDLFRLVVAHALDSDTRRLVSALSASPRGALTALVCQEVFPNTCGSDPFGLPAAIHSRSALVSARAVVASGGPGLATELAPGTDVLAALAGDSRIPERFSPLVDSGVRRGGFLAEAQRQRVGEVATLIEGSEEAPAVIITGAQGTGKRIIGDLLAKALGRQLLAVNAAAPSATSELRNVLSFARLHNRVAYVAGIEAAEEGVVAAALETHDDVAILATRETGLQTLRISRPSHVIAAARPTLEVREEAWRAGLADIKIDSNEAEALAARYVIGSGAICEVLDDADRYAKAAAEELGLEHLEDAISRRLSLNLGVLGQRITRRASFEEMVLPDDVIETLRDLIAMVQGRTKILESWGYERHLGLSRGVSALFSGAPGTGKTMAASVVSSELGLELFRIDLSSVVSKWVGETEKNLARIFDEAQDAHAMLLFDEADSLFGKRTDVQNASDRYANLEVNYVLQRMEQFDGISVLTTNLESGIDPAFMRRLNFRVRFPDPEEEERAALWLKLLPPESGLAGIDIGDLAERFEMTGGHIRNAIVRAAVVASREGRAMEVDDLVRGAHHEYYELGKVMHSSL